VGMNKISNNLKNKIILLIQKKIQKKRDNLKMNFNNINKNYKWRLKSINKKKNI